MRRLLALASVLGMAGSVATAYGQDTAAVVPTTDFFVSSLHKTRAYGSVAELVAGRRRTYLPFLRFTLPAAPAPGRRVILRLFPLVDSPSGLIVRRASGGVWSEHRVRFASAPKTSGSGVSSGPLVKGQWSEIDVTSLVGARTTASLGFVTTSQSPVVVASREAGANAPQVVLR